jgi:hypothetical protein
LLAGRLAWSFLWSVLRSLPGVNKKSPSLGRKGLLTDMFIFH